MFRCRGAGKNGSHYTKSQCKWTILLSKNELVNIARGINKMNHFNLFFLMYTLDESKMLYHFFFLKTFIITKMDCESKSDPPQSIMVPSLPLSWIWNWHTYHFEKLWFMSLVHFLPPTTITPDCLLFEGKPSTKHLCGSYGPCFPFRWSEPDPSARWVCVPVLIIQGDSTP